MRKFEGFVRVAFNARKGAVVLAKGEAGRGYAPDATAAILSAIGRAMEANKNAGFDRWSAWTPGLDRKDAAANYTPAEWKRAVSQPDTTPVVMANRFGSPVLAILSETKKADRRSVLTDY